MKENTNKYTYKVTWKSVVPFKVWFTFSANWKEGIEITDKEKKAILAASRTSTGLVSAGWACRTSA